MKRSSARILTTHAGSLPRPANLLEMGRALADGRPYDRGGYERRVNSTADDIVRKQAALAGVGVEEAFIPAISPSNVEGRQDNAYYKTDEEYLFAIADAMREEYKAIVDAGFLVQIDDPRLVTYYIMDPR